MPFARTLLLAAIFAVTLLSVTLLSPPRAFAQVIRNAELLTESERADFRAQLADVGDSADRAKIKAEMNRIIQGRMLEQRRAARAAKKTLQARKPLAKKP